MKITLKNLHEATAQQVFDQVVIHLLTQMEQSILNSLCAYRGPNGLKCAAGCLIADVEYDPEMERRIWSVLIRKFDITEKHFGLVSYLQTIHDSCQPEDWHQQLMNASKEFDLEWKF